MREISNLPGGLGQAKDGETTVEVRFVNSKGETEVWLLKTGAINSFLKLATAAAPVWKAYVDDGMDTRLANQRASIQRLLDHLEFHHDKLGPVAILGCGYEGKDHA